MRYFVNADVIIPCTVATPFLKYMAEVAVRTCQASTAARIWVRCNNSTDPKLLEEFKHNCALLGVNYTYDKGNWNMNSCYNRGMDGTVGEYVACCAQDMIFFDRWLEKLVEAWQKEPDYYLLMPYSFHHEAKAFTLQSPAPGEGIRKCHDVTSGVTVFKRVNGYRYDEQFADMEQDTDLQFFCEANGLKCGVALASRVDHQWCSVRSHWDMTRAIGVDNYASLAKAALMKKWRK